MRKLKIFTVLLVLSGILVSCVSQPLSDDAGKITDEIEVSTDNTLKDNNAENTDESGLSENKQDEQSSENSGENSVENDKTENSEQSGNKDADGKTDKDKGNVLDGRWLIKAKFQFDSLETFGMTGYSIYKKGNSYGIIDMSGKEIGKGNYSELFYCPVHGLSCPEVSGEPIKLRDDLYLAPDCGYDRDSVSDVTYVFDNTRDRVYVAGMSDGVFRLADITDTEYFKTNERYIVVLYDCDADIMMYEGIGMRSLNEIFKAENKEMHYGVIDTDLDYVIACIYDNVLYGNDCYIVQKDGKYGYRAITGREYYPCVFEHANTAYKGAAWVKYNGKWGTVRF